MEIKNSIRNFPGSADKRYDAVLQAYKKGNYRAALKEAIELIDQGYGHANTLAGAIYERGGDGVERDYDKAKFYYQMAVDSVGAVEGWLALGRLYYFGKGMQADYEKAFHYYSIVDQDTENAVAYLMLGRMHLEGKGTTKNVEKAREYFSKAERQGSVFAITYKALVEKEVGNYWRSLWLRIKAAYLAYVITRRDPNDPRLRRI